MSHRLMLASVLLGWAGLLAGCEAWPMVEFTTPRVMMHVEGDSIQNVEPVRGDVRVEKIDGKMFRVDGTGVVRVIMGVTDTHTVDVDKNKIRVHGVNVASQGAMRDVAVEKNAVLERQVHVDKTKK